MRTLAVAVVEDLRRRAELHHVAARVVGVDGDAPAVIDASDIVSVRDEPILANFEIVEVGGRKRNVVHEVRQPEPGRDRSGVVAEVVVVDVPERDHRAVARVVEEVAGPALLAERNDVDVSEVEAHGLAVEAVAGFEVAGDDGNVVERHGSSLAPLPPVPLTPDSVDPDPIVQFGRWFDAARAAEVRQPDAMTVATSSLDRRGLRSHRAAARARRERLRLLHELRERQGRGVASEPEGCARVPLERTGAPGARLRTGHAGRRCGGRCLLGDEAARPPHQRVGVAAEPGDRGRDARDAHRRHRGALRGRRTCRARRSGAGFALLPPSSSSGRGVPIGLHDRVRYRRGADGAYTRERLAP